MNESQNYVPDNRPDMESDEINLLEYLLVVARNWRLIGKVCAAAFVLSLLVSMMLPNIYVATARLMPPSEGKGGLAAMLGGMGDLAALAGISAGGSSGDLYVGMLKSRTLADTIIDRFNLMEVYDQDYRVKMYEELDELVKISLGKKDGIITISVEDEDATRAADIANTYVEELKELNIQISLDSVGLKRTFFEQRLAVVKEDLTRAEERLSSFQKVSGAIKLDDQAKSIIETIARLKGEIASKEVELGVARSYQTEHNPEVKMLREGITGLKEQLHRLESSPEGEKVSGDIFITTSNVPDVGVQFARVMREFKVQETLHELLTRQYELAKIEAARDISTIQVLDTAVAPDKKSKPKRLLIVLAVTFVSAIAALLWIFIREYSANMNSEDRHMWEEIKAQVRWRGRGK